MEILSSINLFILVGVISINVLLSYAVYKNNSESVTNKIFSSLGLVITIWLLVMYISLQPTQESVSVIWIRMSFFWATLMSYLFVLLAHNLPSERLVINKYKFVILTTLTTIVMTISMSPLSFSRVDVVDNFPNPVPGPGIAAFGVYVMLTTIAAIYALIRRYLKSEIHAKQQVVFIISGMLLMYGLLISTVFFPVAVLRKYTFVPLFPLYTLLFTGLAAYAIVRHNLFNIKIFATQVITIALWIILFSKIFVGVDLSERIIDIIIFFVTLVIGVLLVRSVNNEVKQRKRLEELTRKLEEMDQKKDEFLSVAAHELRSPMTAIRGYLSMILDGDAGKITSKTKEYLGDALMGNDRLVRLVTNMLNVSRIEEGRLPYDMGKINLSEVIKTVFEEYKNEAGNKKLGYKLNIATNIRDLVYVDVDRIHEVVSNLISNAIKYTDEGEVIINALNKDGSNIYVEVVDTGRGLSNEEQQKLFSKFYRAESNIGKQIGTGLGLYISKLLVEKFGGKIGVFSQRDKGSTFWFELPLTK